MNRITFKNLGIAYAIFLGALYLFDKCWPSLSPQGLQIGLLLVSVFNFTFLSLALFPTAFWMIGYFDKLASLNTSRTELINRFKRLGCWSAAVWIWINLISSYFNDVFLPTGDTFMTLFSQNPVILVLQCAFLVIVLAFAVLFSIVLIKDIDDALPSVIPRRLRLPFWFAAVFLFQHFAPDIFPPVLEFIHIKLNILTKFITDTFKAEPFTACLACLCFGFLAGILGSSASALKTLLIMIERHRKGMFAELDELLARCPCRSQEDASAGCVSTCSKQ